MFEIADPEEYLAEEEKTEPQLETPPIAPNPTEIPPIAPGGVNPQSQPLIL